MTLQPNPQSKRTERRAKRNFQGSRPQRRNARRLAWKGVTCNAAGGGFETLSYEGHEPKQRHMQYKGGGNSYHA
jgi:hypothetical protein